MRLRRGDMDQATVYADDPGGAGECLAGGRFAWLHVVDLNGAFAGKPVNADAVRAILAASLSRCSLAAASGTWPGSRPGSMAGVRRVILGSAAAKNPALVIEACRAFPAASPSASMRGMGSSPPKAGPRPPAWQPTDLGAAVRGRGRFGDHLHRYRP